MQPASIAPEARDLLLDRLIEHAYIYDPAGQIPLASGQLSDEYINCKAALSLPHVLHIAAEVLHSQLREDVQAVGGLTMGADPLAIAVSLFSSRRPHVVRWFSVRKDRKAHGLKKLVEGDLPERTRVAVIEDVVTQGSSTLDAIDRLQTEGHTIVQVLALVDREQGGLDKIRDTLGPDVPVRAIFTKSELKQRWQRSRTA
jgi:orotate phosphoribosyltransferase